MVVHKTPFSFREDVLRIMLHLGTLLTLVPVCQLSGESEPRVHLAHICENVHTGPEEGVPVIMLHGMTDIKETWDGIYQTISLLTNRRVCIYDAPNHGDSEWTDIFTVDSLAEALEDFMRSRKIEKAALVGHSLGGLTVMKFALKNPGKVESVFVEDVSPTGIPKDLVAILQSYPRLLVSSLDAIPDDADGDTAKKAVIDYIMKPTPSNEDVVRAVLSATEETPPAHLFKKSPFVRRDGKWQWKANFDAFIKAVDDFDSFLGKMEGRYKGKAFFIYGKDSMFKVDEDEEAIRKLFPNSEFVAVEGADHMVHPNHPEFLIELIKFLKQEGEQRKSEL